MLPIYLVFYLTHLSNFVIFYSGKTTKCMETNNFDEIYFKYFIINN